METPKPHPHAELIKAWADGAMIQLKNVDGEWEDCNFPVWNEKIEYRIRPSNEPWSPKTDEKYFYLDVIYGEFCAVDNTWNSTDTDYALRRNNNIFPTKEEAEAAIHRVEAALKGDFATDNNVGRKSEIDGKPLTDGEIALIRAIRRGARLIDALKDDALEIEGYERSQWVEFDPNDESTYPPNKTHVLVYGLSDNMRDDEKLCGLDVDFWLNDHFVCYCNITHWRPLPPPPGKEEVK